MNDSRKLEQCYACDRPGVSREHAPPLALFPEFKDVGVDLRKRLITVPACDEHNPRKSKDDEYLMMVLVANIGVNEFANQQVATKIVRAWERNPALKDVAVRDPQVSENDGRRTMTFKLDLPRFNGAMELISKAIYRHETGRNWSQPFFSYATSLLPSDPDRSGEVTERTRQFKDLLDRAFEKQPWKGENPDVFKYHIYLPSTEARDPVVCLQMRFYGGFEVMCISGWPST